MATWAALSVREFSASRCHSHRHSDNLSIDAAGSRCRVLCLPGHFACANAVGGREGVVLGAGSDWCVEAGVVVSVVNAAGMRYSRTAAPMSMRVTAAMN